MKTEALTAGASAARMAKVKRKAHTETGEVEALEFEPSIIFIFAGITAALGLISYVLKSSQRIV